MDFTPVSQDNLQEWSAAYQADEKRKMAAMALASNELYASCRDTGAAHEMRQKFSLEVKTLPVTNQKKSGRCWLFAATNILRERIAKDLNLEQFELSQSYLAFWDKFERCNFFLESILETANLPADDRTVAFILATGVHDGGQWDMFANIVRKYGVVPKDVFDETAQSENTRDMNHLLNQHLKACAAKLRRMVHDGAETAMLQAKKTAMLGKIYAFLCSCYGEPPRQFDFEYVDKDGKYFLETGMTPESFRDKYVGDLLDRMVSIIHAPTKDKPMHQTYTIRFLGNVAGGRPVKHLNLEMSEFKAAIIAQLQAGKVVWFGSDVGHYGDRDRGIWDYRMYQDELLSGLKLSISKEDALDYGFSAMNHAMVITGVNLRDGLPTRWKIENSWGDEHGAKGYYVCSDAWFDRFVYQAAVERAYLGDLAACADTDPIELDPWDPMGTLAD